MRKNQARAHAPAREVTGDQAVEHHMQPIHEDRLARGMKLANSPRNEGSCLPGMVRDASGQCIVPPEEG